MNELTPDQQTMLATWQQHTYAEFVLKDPDAALATMTDNPYVLLIPCGTGGVGRAGVREFYANHFLPNIPPDLELTSLSQAFGNDRIVEEFIIRFTHTLDMDWMLPRVPATGRSVEFALVGIIQFQAGKVANERLYWDQATVLSQLGILDHPWRRRGWKCGATSETRHPGGCESLRRKTAAIWGGPANVSSALIGAVGIWKREWLRSDFGRDGGHLP
jgi:carboxymethylenebutenolidase